MPVLVVLRPAVEEFTPPEVLRAVCAMDTLRSGPVTGTATGEIGAARSAACLTHPGEPLSDED